MDQIARTREFWNETPCDGQESYRLRARFRYGKEPWLPSLLQRIASHGYRNIVEVGCGQGTDGITLCTKLDAAARYTGVDLSDVSIGRANAAATEMSGMCVVKPSFRVEHAEQLSFERDSFDCVISIGALHHSASTEAAIAEVRRVLQPGGTAYVLLYRTWAPKLLAAHTLRGVQAIVDLLCRTDHAVYRALRRIRPGEDNFGTMLYECFGVPILRSYTAGGMRTLFKDFDGVRLTAYGTGPATGYLWLAEAKK
jgi:SAM-dependent methyltransferase